MCMQLNSTFSVCCCCCCCYYCCCCCKCCCCGCCCCCCGCCCCCCSGQTFVLCWFFVLWLFIIYNWKQCVSFMVCLVVVRTHGLPSNSASNLTPGQGESESDEESRTGFTSSKRRQEEASPGAARAPMTAGQKKRLRKKRKKALASQVDDGETVLQPHRSVITSNRQVMPMRDLMGEISSCHVYASTTTAPENTKLINCWSFPAKSSGSRNLDLK